MILVFYFKGACYCMLIEKPFGELRSNMCKKADKAYNS